MNDSYTPMSERALELVAHRFKLLSEPMRLRLLQVLMSGEKSVNELVSATGATQANVSKHLGILADGGVVGRRKVGVTIFYHIADPSLRTLCDLVCRSLQEQSSAALQQLTSEQEQPTGDKHDVPNLHRESVKRTRRRADGT